MLGGELDGVLKARGKDHEHMLQGLLQGFRAK